MEQLPVLECQQCGDVIRELSSTEAQDMAYNPNNWIADCWYCRQGHGY